jgi:hypothetical protein
VTGGAFPLGVWGPPQPDDDRKVPAGDALPAIDGATFTATAREIGTLPTPVNYYQVEIGLAPSRKPLPFLPESSQRASFLTDSAPLREFTDVPAADQLDTARSWLARGANSRIAVAALEHDRSAPPLLGSLGEGFVRHTGDIADKHVVTDQPPEPPDTQVYPPRAVALLTTDLAAPPAAAARTTVSSAPDATRVAAPDLATLRARADLAAPLRLSRQPATALSTDTTVIATSLPLTRAARGAVGSPGGRLAPPDAKDRLAALTAALDRSANGGLADAPPSPLRPGEIAVLQLPNAGFDTGSEAGATRPQLLVSGGPARVIALGHGGIVLADGESNGGSIGVVPRTERLVVLAGDPSGGAQGGLTGWHSGQQLPYLGWGTALAAGATIHAEGGSVRRTRDRYRAGWVPGAELVDAAPLVTTRFTDAVTAVAVLLDDPLGTEAARGLGLALNGASRAVDAAGAEIPPVVVALGNRSAVVYAVVPDSVVDRRGGAVAVGVASQAGWHVAGMVGSPGIVGDLVDRLTRTGIDALIRPLVGPTRNLVSVGWQPVAAPPLNAPQPRRSPALVGLTPLEGRMP